MRKQPKSRKTSRANSEWAAATTLKPARVTTLDGVWRKIESLGITERDVENAVRQARKRR